MAVFGAGPSIELRRVLRAIDVIVEQLPLIDIWSTTVLTVPMATRLAGDMFRIMPRDGDTDLVIDDIVVATLDATGYFATELSSITRSRLLSHVSLRNTV